MRVHDEDWETRTRASFARQRMMDTLGVHIAELAPGRCVLAMPYDARFTQQHGYAHAGTTATLANSACGYAAYTLASPDATVLTCTVVAQRDGEAPRVVAQVQATIMRLAGSDRPAGT